MWSAFGPASIPSGVVRPPDDDPHDLPPGAPCWEPSKPVLQCPYCGIKFTFWTRKQVTPLTNTDNEIVKMKFFRINQHHCRCCGRVVCGGCSPHRLDLQHFGYVKPERVCDVCVKSYQDSSPTTLLWIKDGEVTSFTPPAPSGTSMTSEPQFDPPPTIEDAPDPDDISEMMKEAEKTQFTRNSTPNSRVIRFWHDLVSEPSLLSELHLRVLMGVPNYVRGLVWKHLSDAIPSIEKNPEIYDALKQRRNPEVEEMVANDVHRTFPTHPMFAEGSKGQKRLTNVLRAYGNLNHYSQCMSYIAAVLLMHLSEHEAFFVFVQMMKKYGLETLYQRDLPTCLRNYARFIEITKPTLYKHLVDQKLTVDVFVSGWLQTLFAQQFELGLVFRLWDGFFAFGFSFMVKASLVLLHHAEPTLLKLGSTDIIFNLKSLPSRVQDYDRLVEEAMALKLPEDLMTASNEEDRVLNTTHVEPPAKTATKLSHSGSKPRKTHVHSTPTSPIQKHNRNHHSQPPLHHQTNPPKFPTNPTLIPFFKESLDPLRIVPIEPTREATSSPDTASQSTDDSKVSDVTKRTSSDDSLAANHAPTEWDSKISDIST